MFHRNVFSFLVLSIIPFQQALADETTSFYPTWKLLSPEAKEQFMAGYLEGWQDAASVTDIAIDYVKENPLNAVEGLQKIRALYDISSFKAAAIVKEVDDFYSQPLHKTAALSKAVSYAKQKLSR